MINYSIVQIISLAVIIENCKENDKN